MPDTPSPNGASQPAHPADAVFANIERPPRVPPYLAVGLSTTVRGISRRADCWVNLRHLANMIRGAFYTCSINHPIKLVALPEGAISGFTDEAFDVDHVVAARELFIDIPGEETAFLGELARQFDTYIIAQCKARWPEVMPDRFFNTAFIVSPRGEVVHKYAKNHVFPRERSCTPHDVYDRWVEVFGDCLEAFYPVYRSPEIGNVGHIVDYNGNVVCRSASGADTVVAALIDIEQLRLFRERTLRGNWLKDLRCEVFRPIYAQPIHPKNMWLEEAPLGHEAMDAVFRQNVRRLQER